MSDLCIIGIDPGANGAIARIHGNLHSGLTSTSRIVPFVPPAGGKQSGIVQFDIAAALHGLSPSHWPVHIAIERVGAMPGQGVVSMFSFGLNAGAIQALAVSSYPKASVAYVCPQVWKRAFNLLKQPKEASIEIAQQELPDAFQEPFPAKVGSASYIGCCDALLIAKWLFDKIFRESHAS